jgi:hypothetical protein
MSAARISETELRPLPRWQRVALALRCLRRARGLLQPPASQSQVLDDTLEQIQRAVQTGQAGDELADAAAAAYTLALDNLDAVSGSPGGPDRVVCECMAAHAAAFAAEAATLSDPRQAAHLLAQSIDFAIHACRLAQSADTSSVLAGMRADLERLRSVTFPSDDSPVPADFFLPL